MRRRCATGTTCVDSFTQQPSAVAAATLPALQMKKLRHGEFAHSPDLTRLVSDRRDLNPGSPASESRAYLLHCTVSSSWDKQGHLGVGEGREECHATSPLTHVHPGDGSSARPLRPGGWEMLTRAEAGWTPAAGVSSTGRREEAGPAAGTGDPPILSHVTST